LERVGVAGGSLSPTGVSEGRLTEPARFVGVCEEAEEDGAVCVTGIAGKVAFRSMSAGS
jgi:hypothetical protein